MTNEFSKSFDITKQKIRDNFDKAKSQSNDIIDEKANNTEIEENIIDTLPNQWVNSHQKDYSTPFENVNLLATNAEGEVSAVIHNWEVELGIIPEFMIPYIRTEIRVRGGAGGTTIGSAFQFNNVGLLFNKYIQVIDLPNSSQNNVLKEVRVLASFIVSDSDANIGPIQVSLSVILQNPNDFV